MDFGEIVEPVSRAFWDNYDDPDENDVYEDPKLVWMTDSEGPEMPPGKTKIVFFEGESISEFATAVVQKQTPLCQLSTGSCSVYDLPGSGPFLVVVCQEKNLNLFSVIVQLLEPFLETAEKLYTFTVLPEVQHKRSSIDPEDDSICYLRSLNGLTGKPLETPNIITGLAAGVSLWRQWKQLSPASNYVAYMETVTYDSCSTKPLIDLLKKLEVPCADVYKRRFKDESNLYL